MQQSKFGLPVTATGSTRRVAVSNPAVDVQGYELYGKIALRHQRFICFVTPILKKRCLDHNDLSNYMSVSNLFFIAKILEKLVLSKVSTYLNSHNLYNTLYQHIVLVTALKLLSWKLLMICSFLIANATCLY